MFFTVRVPIVCLLFLLYLEITRWQNRMDFWLMNFKNNKKKLNSKSAKVLLSNNIPKLRKKNWLNKLIEISSHTHTHKYITMRDKRTDEQQYVRGIVRKLNRIIERKTDWMSEWASEKLNKAEGGQRERRRGEVYIVKRKSVQAKQKPKWKQSIKIKKQRLRLK